MDNFNFEFEIPEHTPALPYTEIGTNHGQLWFCILDWQNTSSKLKSLRWRFNQSFFWPLQYGPPFWNKMART